jgi:hypothetical protein
MWGYAGARRVRGRERPRRSEMEEPDQTFERETDPDETGISENSPQGGGKGEIGGQGGEGDVEAADIEEEGEHGQTSVDAPEDDAGEAAPDD